MGPLDRYPMVLTLDTSGYVAVHGPLPVFVIAAILRDVTAKLETGQMVITPPPEWPTGGPGVPGGPYAT